VLFLQLRVIDFPYLHTGDPSSTPYAPAALFVFAFASGFAEQLFFGALEKMTRRPSLRERQATVPEYSEPI